jgi:cyclopropane-fatty-acyl-phospholipid synthase
MSFGTVGIELAERGLLPDKFIRAGIRRLCRARLEEIRSATPSSSEQAEREFADFMRSGPLAPVPDAANEQHYEVPAAFYEMALGHRRKYSGCYWPGSVDSLNDAEDEALRVTCEHAGLDDGMDILELGCGWGSLTLYMAERYPNSSITAVSNSASQRKYILAQADAQNLGNIRVITQDMNDFEIEERFDRVVSIEMFEHMRNYELLLQRVSGWLKPDGRLFVHIFAHKAYPYAFETEGAGNWMGRHFFTGGIMPSQSLFRQFQSHLVVQNEWVWDGTHYQKTAEGWLKNLDQHKEQVISLFATDKGVREARRMYHRWRIFFLACAETFGFDSGKEWVVGHYLFEPVSSSSVTEQESVEKNRESKKVVT